MAVTPPGLPKKENLLSDKFKSKKYVQSRIATLIGPGTRIEGNITFTGGLRTDGEIIGDVSCADAHGVLVVGKLGSVTGTVKAPHVVVSGRVDGPLHSSESIEIHPQACVTGGASYKDIVIHEGGVIQGTLTPNWPSDQDRSGQIHRVLSLESPAVQDSTELPVEVMAGAREIENTPGKQRKFGFVVALLIAVVAVVWLSLKPADVKSAASELALKTENAATENLAPPSVPSVPPAPSVLPVPSVPVASATPLESPAVVKVSPVPAAPISEPVSKLAVPATPPDVPTVDMKNVTVVNGDSPSKPADFVYAEIGKEPVVLFKKQRNDPGEGTRISAAPGTKKRIPISKNDLLRVEQGKGLQMFFQGRKVAPTNMESGVWLSFVPNSRSGASGQ